MNKILEIFKKRKPIHEIPLNKMSAAINEWTALYENRYSAVSDEIKNLNIAAAISSELARLTTIEFSSSITGSKRADFLDEQYQRLIKKSRVFVEYACAKGGVILKPYLENGKILVSIIQADSFYPTDFTSEGELCGAIFYESFKEDEYYYIRLEEHKLINNCLMIKNTAYKSKHPDTLEKEIPLGSVDKWASITPICRIENIDKPLFAYLKMPMANTIDSSSPLGVSVFARATDLIRDAYSQYSNLLWEFESGKRALFIDECAVRRDENGNASLPEKRLYRLLSTGDDSLFEDWSPQFREANILSGLDRILRSIEFNCGLAYGTLSDTQNVDKTAEEIRASKQRSYATVCDIQNALKLALEHLVWAMNVYCDMYSLIPKGDYSISFDFDDSIITDRSAEFAEKISLLDKGILSAWEMRSWYFNEDEKTAKARIGEINEIRNSNNMAQNQ